MFLCKSETTTLHLILTKLEKLVYHTQNNFLTKNTHRSLRNLPDYSHLGQNLQQNNTFMRSRSPDRKPNICYGT